MCHYTTLTLSLPLYQETSHLHVSTHPIIHRIPTLLNRLLCNATLVIIQPIRFIMQIRITH